MAAEEVQGSYENSIATAWVIYVLALVGGYWYFKPALHFDLLHLVFVFPLFMVGGFIFSQLIMAPMWVYSNNSIPLLAMILVFLPVKVLMAQSNADASLPPWGGFGLDAVIGVCMFAIVWQATYHIRHNNGFSFGKSWYKTVHGGTYREYYQYQGVASGSLWCLQFVVALCAWFVLQFTPGISMFPFARTNPQPVAATTNNSAPVTPVLPQTVPDAAPADQYEAFLRIPKLELVADQLIIHVSTNLPDGIRLTAQLTWRDRQREEVSETVRNGVCVFPRLLYDSLGSPGVIVSTAPWENQPPEILATLGKHGERLAGEHVAVDEQGHKHIRVMRDVNQALKASAGNPGHPQSSAGSQATPGSTDRELRTWTSDVGTTMEARFVAIVLRMNQRAVKLQKPDGTTIEVPLHRLSLADQQYVNSGSQPDSP
jgi:hypothetical protein